MKLLYDTTKKLARKYNKQERPVKDKEGRPIIETQEQWNRWVEYFEELLNRPASMNPPDIEAAHTDLPIDVIPTTTEEMRMAIRQIKRGKAAAPGNILAEVRHRSNYKHASPSIEEDLSGGTSASGLKKGHLIKISKKGDLSKCGNYRGITLLNAALTLLIPAFTSASDPPCSSMILPRYVKDSTSPRVSPSR
ncbi:unnamed protein product [Schistosoma mattheei]|uniref:Uncharacterized protein n=1 Tax=Schistosoma mattheei TaxID=31246 RepID=A0A183NQI4_9TREM|nr:unnamed protein product [Schistosoma mattheei]